MTQISNGHVKVMIQNKHWQLPSIFVNKTNDCSYTISRPVTFQQVFFSSRGANLLFWAWRSEWKSGWQLEESVCEALLSVREGLHLETLKFWSILALYHQLQTTILEKAILAKSNLKSSVSPVWTVVAVFSLKWVLSPLHLYPGLPTLIYTLNPH